MANDLSLSVKLGASLDSGFRGMFGSASKSVGKLGEAMKATHAQLNNIRAYQRNESALNATRVKLGETQAKAQALRLEMSKTGGSAKLSAAFDAAHGKAVKLSAALEAQRANLRMEGTALRNAGIDAKNLSGANERLTRTLEKQKGVMASNYRLMARRKELRDQLIGQWAKLGTAIIAVRALGGWTKDAADFDAEMQSIGNTADLSAEQISGLRDAIFEASKQTGRSIGDVQAGIGFLTAAGLDIGRAQKSIVAIGRAATAETAPIEDLSKASFVLIDSMGIKPEGLNDALDVLTQAGKDGNVELRDMAQQLPALGASFKALHMQGAGAVATMGAALEVARKGAADPAEAANNMRNFLKALTSQTVLQAAQKNFGLNLQKVLENAQAAGANPFEAVMDAIMKTTKGDAFAIAKIFNDAQAQNFLRPMIQNWKEYQKIKTDALSAHGVVDRDFAKMQKTTAQGLTRMGNAWRAFKTNVGAAIGSVFVKLFGWITPVLNGVAKLAGEFPKLTVAVLGAAGAFLTFKTAVTGIKFLETFLPSLGKLGGMVRMLIPGLGMAEGAAAGLSGVFAGLGAAIEATPIGWVITIVAAVVGALVVGALVVRKYWEPIKAFFVGVWQGVKEAMEPVLTDMAESLAPLKPAWDAIASAIGPVVAWFKDLLNPMHATQEQLDKATSAGKVFGHALGFAFKVVSFNIRYTIKAAMWLGTTLGKFAGWYVVTFTRVTDWWRSRWRGAIGFVTRLWGDYKAGVKIIVDWISTKIDWVLAKWESVKNTVAQIGDVASQMMGTKPTAPEHRTRTTLGRTAMALAFGPLGMLAAPTLAAAGAARSHSVPAISMPAARGNTPVVVQAGATNINIHPAAGVDPVAIGAEVDRRLDARDRKQAARVRSTLGDTD